MIKHGVLVEVRIELVIEGEPRSYSDVNEQALEIVGQYLAMMTAPEIKGYGTEIIDHWHEEH